jgi:uncharacterized protein YsxB (DUF464 family)
MGITAIVCIAVVVLAIVIVLTILVYNQMLLTNEVNKRLLLMTKESIDKERSTQQELQDALVAMEQMAQDSQPSNTQTDTPSGFQDDDLDI